MKAFERVKGSIYKRKIKEWLGRNKYVISFVAFAVVLAAAFVLYERKTVNIVLDGEKETVVTYVKKVGLLLEGKGISIEPKDKIDRNLNAKLADRDTITIKKAVGITVNVDRQELKLKSAESDVASMLSAEGIETKLDDRITPAPDERLYDGMAVTVVRVAVNEMTEKVPVDYQRVVRNDPNLLATQSKVLQKGSTGEKQVSYKILYEDGKETTREIVNEVLLKAPVSEILIKGALPVFNISRGDSGVSYSKEFVVKSTAYYAVNGVGKTYTASGRKAVRDPYSFSTIAVDPSVIPLGTKLYVESYGYAIAADKGDDVKGNFIDVFFDTRQEASRWGVKYVKVYFLK